MSAYIGLDVHKDWTFATVLDQTGRVVAQRKLANEHVPSFLEQFNVLKVGLESSTYIVPLYRALVDRGFRVEVGHPKKTRYIAEARIKSDRVDSKAIAELVRLEALPQSYMPPPEIACLREKVRRRAFLVRERAKLKAKIRGVLAYEGLKPPEGLGLFTRKGVDWLRSLGLEPITLLSPPNPGVRITTAFRVIFWVSLAVGLYECGIANHYLALNESRIPKPVHKVFHCAFKPFRAYTLSKTRNLKGMVGLLMLFYVA
jgi:hypothetical protein